MHSLEFWNTSPSDCQLIAGFQPECRGWVWTHLPACYSALTLYQAMSMGYRFNRMQDQFLPLWILIYLGQMGTRWWACLSRMSLRVRQENINTYTCLKPGDGLHLAIQKTGDVVFCMETGVYSYIPKLQRRRGMIIRNFPIMENGKW